MSDGCLFGGHAAAQGVKADLLAIEVDLGADHPSAPAAADEKFLFGHKTEAMFGAMVASLGSVKLIKAEDGSDCFAQDSSLEVPDFRVVLSTQEQMLIEAKNFHQGDSPTKPYRLKTSYLKGLRAYAALMKCSLGIAVYWSRWNLWSLTSPDAFSQSGEWSSIDLGTAMMRNEMSVVGDLQVGTKMPLKMVFDVEQLSESGKDLASGELTVQITKSSLSCAGKPIDDPMEKRIAFYLMLYGNLVEDSLPVFKDDRIVAIEHCFQKEEETGQRFEIVGSLSSMFSRFYRHATSDKDEGGIAQIHA